MAKVISLGLLPPDHPIFSGGLEISSPQGSRPSLSGLVRNTGGATPSSSSDESKLPQVPDSESQESCVEEPGEDDGRDSGESEGERARDLEG